VSKAGRRLDKFSIEERHGLRKDLKTLRYTVELLASLYPAKNVRRFAGKLRRLQDGFGYLHDLVVAKKLKSLDTDGFATADVQRAVGYALGWHTAHAEDAWSDIKRKGAGSNGGVVLGPVSAGVCPDLTTNLWQKCQVGA
jgi:triphosphatase